MFSKTETFESQVLPGATFTIQKVGIGKRLEVERKTVDLRYELFCLTNDYLSIVSDTKELSKLPKDDQRAASKLDMLYDLKKKEIEQEWARSLLLKVSIEGQDVPVDDFLQCGDDALMAEVQQKINEYARLNAAEVPNSERPTTSIEAVDGPTETTTAETVKTSDSTGTATA